MSTIEQIKEKSDEAKLQTKLTVRAVESTTGEKNERTELFIQIPFDRDFKTIVLDKEHEALERIFNSNFDKFKFLKGFEAIYSTELGIIECEIQTDDSRNTWFMIRRLSKFFKAKLVEPDSEAEEVEDYNFEFPSPEDNIKIFIGQSSDEFSLLSGNKREMIFRRRLRSFQTIRLEGLTFQTHNQAKELISTIGNAIFFQIDLITNIPIHLASDRDLERDLQKGARLRRKLANENTAFNAPKFQYDLEPISLYWYARTAINMPLLQFLAFYQVLEFYFPMYSSKDAQEKIKNLLKDPTFDRNIDKNITKILDLIKIHGKGKSFGDERSQMRATIQTCVDQSDLNDFFNEDNNRKDFFDDQKKSKSLINQKISFGRKDHDLRFDVANRIYDLRCRIVHTKDDPETELLLPFSQDLEHIKYDVDLVEFLARKVLIASGKPLNLSV